MRAELSNHIEELSIWSIDCIGEQGEPADFAIGLLIYSSATLHMLCAAGSFRRLLTYLIFVICFPHSTANHKKRCQGQNCLCEAYGKD